MQSYAAAEPLPSLGLILLPTKSTLYTVCLRFCIRMCDLCLPVTWVRITFGKRVILQSFWSTKEYLSSYLKREFHLQTRLGEPSDVKKATLDPESMILVRCIHQCTCIGTGNVVYTTASHSRLKTKQMFWTKNFSWPNRNSWRLRKRNGSRKRKLLRWGIPPIFPI